MNRQIAFAILCCSILLASSRLLGQGPFDEFDSSRFLPDLHHHSPLGLLVTQAPGGVVVQNVRPGSIAAGQLDVFDVIRSVNNQNVVDERDFYRLIERSRGDIRLVVWKSRLKRDALIVLRQTGGGGNPSTPSQSMLGILYTFSPELGITITDVIPGTPAARAGLAASLNIVEINGTLMRSSAALEEAIATGGNLRLRLYDRVRQRWQNMTINVGPPGGVNPQPPANGDLASILGVTLNNYDQRSGIVISRVLPRSIASMSRLKAGDLIIAVDQIPIRRLDDLDNWSTAGQPTISLTVRSRGPGNSFGQPITRTLLIDPGAITFP